MNNSPSSLSPHPSAVPDIRTSLTVRNTFIEFDDPEGDGNGLWGRQVSEPAKPCGRQVSDQTTSASGGAGAAGSDQEDGTQFAQYLAAAAKGQQTTAPSNGAPNWQVGGLMVPQEAQMAPVAPLTTRFCPNCGHEVEPTHRFCPFCRYQLQGGNVAAPPAGYVISVAAPVSQVVQPPAGSDLLSSVRRFRFVEASPSDIQLAQVACLNHRQTGVVH
jgi:hypothetical protein